MPQGRHRKIAKKARKSHAKRPTKHQRPLTAGQKAKVEACMDVALVEAIRFASRYGLMDRIDELKSHAENALLYASRNHVRGKAGIRTLATLVVRREWKEWLRREAKAGRHSGQEECPRIDNAPSPEEQVEARELSQHMAEALCCLNGFDRDILDRLIVNGETLEEVGESIGYSLNRVHQLRNDALERLRVVFQSRLYGEPPNLFNNVA